MNYNKLNNLNDKYFVYRERRRAAKDNVDQNLNDNNDEMKRKFRGNKVKRKLRERKHVLNVKMNKLSKIKKEREYRYQSTNLSEKEKIRKEFEKGNKVMKDKMRDMKNEKQFIIRLREINNRLLRENKGIKIQLEEMSKLSKKDNVKKENENANENIQTGRGENRFLKSVIQNLRKWLAML